MKKTVLIALCAVLCLSLCGCGGTGDSSGSSGSGSSDAGQSSGVSSDSGSSSGEAADSIKGKAQKLLAEVEFEFSMNETTADKLDYLYGIKEADVKEFAAYTSGGAVPDEFGIFVAKDAEAAKRIKEALDGRVQAQYDSYKDYKPEAMYRFDDDFVELNGTTVIYAICDDNEKAKDILK